MNTTPPKSRADSNGDFLAVAVAGESASSIPGASLNLINCIVGAGIVAIPHAIQQCGLCLGVFLLVFLAYSICQLITILMECALKAGKLNLEELSGHLFGSAGYDLAAVVMILYAFGSMVACLVIIGDTLPPSLDDFFGVERVQTRDEIVVIAAVMIVLPLSLVRHISSLAFASGVAFLAVGVLVLGVLVVGPSEASTQRLVFDSAEDFTIVNKHVFRGIGILSFHYVCQHSCLLIFKSLERPSMESVREVSQLSLGVVLLMSLLIGLGGYVCFGQTATGNILNNFHTNNEMIIIARLCMAINMMFTYPMECFVVRHAFFALLNKYFPIRRTRPMYEAANSLSEHSSMGSASIGAASMSNASLSSVSLSSTSSKGSSSSSVGVIEEYNDDGVLLGQWHSVGLSSVRGAPRGATIAFSDAYGDNDYVESESGDESGAHHSEDTLWPPTTLHVLATVCLWSISLCIAIGFDDVSVVLAFSGIVAASILGYILPVAIYLKTHEEKVRQKLASLGLCECVVGADMTRDDEDREDSEEEEEGQREFDRNIVFFGVLGVFGACSLVVGLVMELLSLFGGGAQIDPTANY